MQNSNIFHPKEALFQADAKIAIPESQTNQGDHYKVRGKVNNAKGTKYMQFDDSESQIEEQQKQQPHPNFKQYEDDDIDLEYNFNNLLNNIENLTPELLPQGETPVPQNNAANQDNNANRANGQNPQAEGQQVPANLPPEIPEAEINKIYDSYIDIYIYLLLFYSVLFTINMQLLPYTTVFGILWLIDVLVFRKKIKEYRATPVEDKPNRRKCMALAIEAVLFALCKVEFVSFYKVIQFE